MSLFKKKGPKPAFKPRLSEVAAEDTIKTAGDEDSAGAESPSAIATKLKKQAKKAKAKTQNKTRTKAEKSRSVTWRTRSGRILSVVMRSSHRTCKRECRRRMRA